MKKTNPFSIPSLLFPYSTPFLLKQSPFQLPLPSIAMPASNACSQPSPPPSPLPRKKRTINNQSSLSSWQLKLLSAYLMPPPPMHRCCCHHHHAAATFPNALLLQLKLRFHQAATSATKLVATTSAAMLPTPHYHCLQNIKKCNTID